MLSTLAGAALERAPCTERSNPTARGAARGARADRGGSATRSGRRPHQAARSAAPRAWWGSTTHALCMCMYESMGAYSTQESCSSILASFLIHSTAVVGGVVVGAVRGRRRGRVVRRRARLRWGVCLLLLLLLLLVQDAGHVDGCFGRSRAVPCWDGPVPRFERSGAGRLRLVPSPLRSRRASAMGPW